MKGRGETTVLTAPLIVAIDTETTGLGHNDSRGPRPDGIVQVGIAWRDPTSSVKTWSTLCNPGQRFLADGRAAEALTVNGLTVNKISRAPPAAAAAQELRAVLERLKRGGTIVELRAFNVGFDRPFLEAAPWQLALSWGECLMRRSASRFGGSYGRIPLWRACAAAGVTFDGRAHSADVDARAALLLSEFLDGQDSASRSHTQRRGSS